MTTLSLSNREAEILEKLCEGMSSPQIAHTLFISVHTVQTHRKNILRKLGVHSMVLAARLYTQGKIEVLSHRVESELPGIIVEPHALRTVA